MPKPGSTIITAILEMRKQSHREVKQSSKAHTIRTQ